MRPNRTAQTSDADGMDLQGDLVRQAPRVTTVGGRSPGSWVIALASSPRTYSSGGAMVFGSWLTVAGTSAASVFPSLNTLLITEDTVTAELRFAKS